MRVRGLPKCMMLITGHTQNGINYCLFVNMSRGSAVGIVTAYGLDVRGGRSSSPDRVKNFNFSIKSRSALRPPNLSNGYRGIFPRG
jgi:hypothetical protein